MKKLIGCVLTIGLASIAQSLEAQQQQQSLPPLSAEAEAALDGLSQRFAAEEELLQGWFRDRMVLYYDFGAVPAGVAAGQVYWPIHGFDVRGNPVAIRGQRPIFSTIPWLGDYTGLWRITYVVTADNVQPNTLRDIESVNATVARKKASLKETDLIVNLPIVPRGTTLARDSTQGMLGWYQGREVQFFDFGQASLAPAPMWRFVRGRDAMGNPILVEGQNGIVDSVPVTPTYPDVWDIRWVKVDSAYVANSVKSLSALRTAAFSVDSATTMRNLPFAVIDGAPIKRVASPLKTFADLRSPFPPRPTPPQ